MTKIFKIEILGDNTIWWKKYNEYPDLIWIEKNQNIYGGNSKNCFLFSKKLRRTPGKQNKKKD